MYYPNVLQMSAVTLDVCKQARAKRLERLKTKQTLVLSIFSSADYFTADENHEKMLF